MRIDITQEETNKFDYERFNYPHPLVQTKMEVLYLKTQGIRHKEICSSCKISKTTLTIYIYYTISIRRGRRTRKINHKGQTSNLNRYSDILEDYFDKNPASSIAEASNAIGKLTGLKRSLTQVREFLKRTGLRCLKVGYVPGTSVELEKIEEVEKYRVKNLGLLLQEAIS